jgi:hypothetical protein
MLLRNIFFVMRLSIDGLILVFLNSLISETFIAAYAEFILFYLSLKALN